MKILGVFISMLLTQAAFAYTTQEGLQAAWLDENHAIKTYSAVIEKFGDVKPFSNIVNAEKKHRKAVENVANQLGIFLDKEDDYIAPDFASVRLACSGGIQGEIDNVALYDNMIPYETNEDVINVYRTLRDASLLSHLPAFQKCAR